MEKLLAELSEQSQMGKFARDPSVEEDEVALVRWNDVRSLPYLSAVINEGLRIHPAAGLVLERVVPAQGLNVDGHHIPAGTIVGCSAWVIHRDATVFGSNPTEFRPERWIDASPEQQAKMKNTLFSFGAGSRACIGRNISLLEMYKLVPALLRTFEVSSLESTLTWRKDANTYTIFQIELVDPHKPWTLHNAWFVKQSDFRVQLKLRPKVL